MAPRSLSLFAPAPGGAGLPRSGALPSFGASGSGSPPPAGAGSRAAAVGAVGGQGLLFADGGPRLVAFSGARDLCGDGCARGAQLAVALAAAGWSVLVGDARGLDAAVRSSGAPGVRVFSVAKAPRVRGAFAARSVAMVRACAAGPAGSLLVVFPSRPCPVVVRPSADPFGAFCGAGSGSWSSAAFAAGLGLPVVCFPFGFSRLPAWGCWRPVGSGLFLGGFLLPPS